MNAHVFRVTDLWYEEQLLAVSVQGLLNKTGAALWLWWTEVDDRWQEHLAER